MTDDIEHHFMILLAMYMSSLVRYSDFLYIFNLSYLFSYCWGLRVICIFCVKSIIRHILQIFSGILWLVFGFSCTFEQEFSSSRIIGWQSFGFNILKEIVWSPWFLLRNYHFDSDVDRYVSLWVLWNLLSFFRLIDFQIILALSLFSFSLRLSLKI